MNLAELVEASARTHAPRPAVTDVRSGHCLAYARARSRGGARRRVLAPTGRGARPADRTAGSERHGLPARGVRSPGRRRLPGPRRRQPDAGGDRADPAGRRGERLPGLARGRRPARSGGARDTRGRRMRRVHVPVDRSRGERSRRPQSPQPGLHPLHLGDDGHPQGRRAVPRGDRRPRRGLRSGAAIHRGGPDSLGAAAGLPFRGHDRRLRAGGRAHPAVPRHPARGSIVDVDPATARERVLCVAAPLRAHGQPRAHGSARQHQAGAVDQRADRARGDGPLCVDVRRPGRPGLRDHRGRAAMHQPGHRRSAGRLGRSASSPDTRSPCFRRRADRLPSGAPGEVGVRGDGLFSAYYAPWTPREQIARDGWFLTGDIGRLDNDGRALSPGPQEGRHLRGGPQVLSRRGRGVHQRSFPESRSRAWSGRPHAHLGRCPWPRWSSTPRTRTWTRSGRTVRAHCRRTRFRWSSPSSTRSRGRRAARSDGARRRAGAAAIESPRDHAGFSPTYSLRSPPRTRRSTPVKPLDFNTPRIVSGGTHSAIVSQ